MASKDLKKRKDDRFKDQHEKPRMYGHPTEGWGFGKLGDAKHKEQISIDDKVPGNRNNVKGKGTATRRGDTFKNNRGNWSFGRL